MSVKAVIVAVLLVLGSVQCQRDPEFDVVMGYNPANAALCAVATKTLIGRVIRAGKAHQLSEKLGSLASELVRVIEICKTAKNFPTRWDEIGYRCMDYISPVAVAVMDLKKTYDHIPSLVLTMAKINKEVMNVLAHQPEIEEKCAKYFGLN